MRAAPGTWVGRPLAIALLAVVAVLTGGVQQARAGAPVTVEPCRSSMGHHWAAPMVTTHWRLLDHCPFELVLESDDDVGENRWWAQWQFPGVTLGRSPIVGLSVDLAGGDGSDGNRTQGVMLCDDAGTCGPLITPSGPAVHTPERHTASVTAGTIPPNATQMRIVGGCNAGGCRAGAPLRISNIRLTIDGDDANPEISLTPPDEYETAHPRLALGEWNTELRDLVLTFSDVGTGVKSVELVPGLAMLEVPFGCGSTNDPVIPKLCDLDAHFVRTLDLGTTQLASYGLRVGNNAIRVVAIDAAGNRSAPFESTFKVDYQAPIVSDLRATTSTDAGWQSGTELDVVWTNFVESAETETQSGVVRARYVLQPAGSTVTRGSLMREQSEIASFDDIALPGPGLWRVLVTTWDRAGNRSDSRELLVGVDPVIPEAPAVTAPAVLGAPELAAGAEVGWTPPTNASEQRSGICRYAVSFDRLPVADPMNAMTVAGDKSSIRVPEYLADGDNYVHVRAISCAGVAGRTAHARVSVDAAPPSIAISKPHDSGWYDSHNPFVVSARDATGATTRIAVEVDGRQNDWIEARDVTVPLADGSHNVVLRAMDALGNETSRQITARFDDSGPIAWFAPSAPAQPTLVSASVVDIHSGVTSAWIEYRHSPDGDWLPLGAATRPSSQPGGMDLLARFPDLQLSVGDYELRAIAYDAAGHVTVSSLRLDGTQARILLPLRQTPSLSAGLRTQVVVKRCGERVKSCRPVKRTRLSDALMVGYRGSAMVTGRLLDEIGDPLGAAELDLFEDGLTTGRRHLRTVPIDANGEFGFRTEPGTSRRIVLRYAGGEKHSPVETSMRLLVRSGVSLKVTSRRAGTASVIRFSGSVRAAGAEFPTRGKAVEIEYRLRGRWLPFPVRARAINGRFSAEYSMKAARAGGRRVGFTFRAVVPAEDHWPYERGESRSVAVVTR